MYKLGMNCDAKLGMRAPPVEDDGWLITQATWKRGDLFVDNDKLSFCFNVPHLAEPEEAKRAIPIDWIEINLKILPLPERLTCIGQFLDRADALIKRLPIG